MRITYLLYLLAPVFIVVSQPARADGTTGENPWPLCPPDFIIPPRPPFDPALQPDEIEIRSDEADIVMDGISDFMGNVTVSGQHQATRSDFMRYDQPNEWAEFIGDVHFWDEDVYLHGHRAEVELDKDHGTYFDTDYMLPANRGRGYTDELYHERERLTRMKNVDYTTCSPDDLFWQVTSSTLTLDHERDQGTAQHAVLRIKGVPVLYTPYATFPLSDERKTGFLFPAFGTSSSGGIETETPFYWNIAPHMDATITPRVMSDRGVMLMTEYRYLLEQGRGQVDLEYMPSDSESDNDERGLFAVRHDQTFLDGRGRLDVDFNWVSDKDYFEDFGTSLAINSTRFLNQRADLRYRGNWWWLMTRVQGFQSVDRTLPGERRPFQRLPQVRFDSRFPTRNHQLNFQFQSEVVHFTRKDVDRPGTIDDVVGTRFDLMPHISYPMRTMSGFIEPKVGMRYTQYFLDHGGAFEDRPSRTLPFASLNSGLYFDRDVSLFGNAYQQTLEPRLYYLYVPATNQDDLPLFDTGLRDFSFSQLFQENRFSGADRFGDANQMTMAVTSRLLDMERGRELGRASLGQIFYLRDRTVRLRPGDMNTDNRTSSIVGELATRVIPDWELQGAIQWDPHNTRTEKLSTRLSYNPDDGGVVNLAYRIRQDDRALRRNVARVTDVEQTDLSFYWPINPNWGVVGRWNYAISEDRTLEIFGGIEYENCCWAIRAVARRFLATIDGDFNNAFMLQFELKGLAGIGRKAGTFLDNSIRGYEPEDFQRHSTLW